MIREITPLHPETLAYRTYRVWSDFWITRETFAYKIPPLFFYDKTSNGAALLIVACSFEEVALFIASQAADLEIRHSYESSDIGPEWIGHWSLIQVAPITNA